MEEKCENGRTLWTTESSSTPRSSSRRPSPPPPLVSIRSRQGDTSSVLSSLTTTTQRKASEESRRKGGKRRGGSPQSAKKRKKKKVDNSIDEPIDLCSSSDDEEFDESVDEDAELAKAKRCVLPPFRPPLFLRPSLLTPPPPLPPRLSLLDQTSPAQPGKSFTSYSISGPTMAIGKFVGKFVASGPKLTIKVSTGPNPKMKITYIRPSRGKQCEKGTTRTI